VDPVPDQGKQARLAATVGTGDAHPLPRVDAEAGIREQEFGSTAQAELLKSEHGGEFISF